MTKKATVVWAEVFLLVVFLSTVCFSQTDSQNKIIEATSTCGYAAAIFDSFANGFEANKTIIIISYKGKKDIQKEIVGKRLYNAKKYLTEFYYKGSPLLRSPDKVITAIGTDKTEEGRLDFYIDGKLRLTMFFLKNRNFGLSSCYSGYKE